MLTNKFEYRGLMFSFDDISEEFYARKEKKINKLLESQNDNVDLLKRASKKYPLAGELAVALEKCAPGARCKISMCAHCGNAAKRYFNMICDADASSVYQNAFALDDTSPVTIEDALSTFEFARSLGGSRGS